MIYLKIKLDTVYNIMKKLCLVKKSVVNTDTSPVVNEPTGKKPLIIKKFTTNPSNNIDNNIDNSVKTTKNIVEKEPEKAKPQAKAKEPGKTKEKPNFVPKKIIKKRVITEDCLPHAVEYYSWCKEEI
jgi:hypothetical protein